MISVGLIILTIAIVGAFIGLLFVAAAKAINDHVFNTYGKYDENKETQETSEVGPAKAPVRADTT